jgi:hypothetical protein
MCLRLRIGTHIIATVAKRRRVFISYHHRRDQGYKTWLARQHHYSRLSFFDRSLSRRVRSFNHYYIMEVIRQHMRGASVLVVLCGEDTFLRKYVDWEVLAGLNREMGLVAVALPECFMWPLRVSRNLQSGYAVSCSWSQFVSNPSFFLEMALTRAKWKIDRSLGSLR